MTTNELMLGDWVQYKDMYWTVTAILNGIVVVDGTENEWYAGSSELTPIPLTTEILRKNGLFHDPYLNDVEDCDGDIFLPRHFEEDEESNLELIKDNGKIYWSIAGGEYYIIELRYVHQLQHALRLCGINKDIEL